MITFTLIVISLAIIGTVGTKYGAEDRPGFNERPPIV
jgi:hypothetical protein